MSTRRASTAGVTADVLFVGLTRPAMAFGVPYAALLVNGVLTVEAFLLTRNLLALLVFLPVHGLARLAANSDPRFFEIWSAWAASTTRHRLANASHWRARSLGPLRAKAEPWVRP